MVELDHFAGLDFQRRRAGRILVGDCGNALIPRCPNGGVCAAILVEANNVMRLIAFILIILILLASAVRKDERALPVIVSPNRTRSECRKIRRNRKHVRWIFNSYACIALDYALKRVGGGAYDLTGAGEHNLAGEQVTFKRQRLIGSKIECRLVCSNFFVAKVKRTAAIHIHCTVTTV